MRFPAPDINKWLTDYIDKLFKKYKMPTELTFDLWVKCIGIDEIEGGKRITFASTDVVDGSLPWGGSFYVDFATEDPSVDDFVLYEHYKFVGPRPTHPH